MFTSTQHRYRKYIILLLVTLALLVTGCSQPPKRLETSKTKASATAIKQTSELPTPRAYTTTPAVTGTPTATPAPISPLGVDIDTLQNTRIQFWHIWPGAAGEAVDQIIEEFNTKNELGIQVQAEYQGNLDENFSNVHSAIEINSPPDVVVGYLYQALDWDAEWEVVDLNDYVDDPVWGLSQEEQDDFYPSFWEHDQFDGKRIGVPAQRSGQVLYYNATWREELGFSEPPATPEEFRGQACAAAQANLDDDDPDNNGTGGWIISTDYSAVLGWLYAFGAEVAPVSGSAPGVSAYEFDVQQVEDTFTYLRDLYDEGCAWLSDNQYPNEDFANRRGLFAADSVTGIPHQRAAFEQAGNSDQWTIIPFPSPEGDPKTSVYGPSFEILTSTPREQLASWLFTKWLISPQNQARLIEVTNTYPLRSGVLERLEELGGPSPQWTAATKLLTDAQSEPPLHSWIIVRWAVRDAATQLFRFYFTIDSVPELVSFLHQTANDLHKDPLVDSSIKTPTPTATSTFTATPTDVPEATPTP